MTVTSIDAPMATATRPCTVADFVTTPGRFDTVTIATRSTASLQAAGVEQNLWPTVPMLDTADDQAGCRRASLTVSPHADGDFA